MQQIEDDEVVDFGFGFDLVGQFWIAYDFVFCGEMHAATMWLLIVSTTSLHYWFSIPSGATDRQGPHCSGTLRSASSISGAGSTF